MEYTVEKFHCNGYNSLFVHNQPRGGQRNFHLLLNRQLDVVPSPQREYKSKLVGNRLYGVGSMDMKTNLVTMIYVFKELAKEVKFPLALQTVTDEEVGGFYGTKYQVESSTTADFVIAGEATNFDIVNKVKGILWTKIKCQGVSAHGAYPWLETTLY